MNEGERSRAAQFIKRLPIFRNLSNDNQDQIIADFSIVTFKKGDTIFYQTEESTDLYVVLNGSVQASLQNEEGQELVLTHFKEGDFFGEFSLLDGRPRSATMIAKEDSTLSVLKRAKFLGTLTKEPVIAIDMLSALVERLRKADEMIESLAFLDVRERVVKILIQMAEAEGQVEDNKIYKVKKITHKELAARTGASREAITKVMKVLNFNKVITDDGEYFHIFPE